MRALAPLLAIAALAGCRVNLEGAPCNGDENCPLAQWCTNAGTCTERLPTVDEGCDQVARIILGRFSACYSGPVDAWRTQMQVDAICRSVAASVTEGTLAFAGKQIRQCKAALNQRACTDISAVPLLADCQMFTPAAAPTAPCNSTFDCTSGWCQVTAACPGQCTPYVAIDAACTAADRCPPGSTCANGFCRAYRALNDPCSADAPCEPYALLCTGGPATCQPRKTSGTCVTSAECLPSYNCTPPLIGGSCTPAKHLADSCTSGRYECELFTRCSNVTSQCTLLSEAGGSCLILEGELAGCLDANCSWGTCASYRAIGAACGSNADCGPLAHCNTVCVSDFCTP